MKIITLVTTLLLTIQITFGQKNKTHNQFFGDPVVTDSNSTVMIPVSYEPDNLSMSKFYSGSNFYANFIFYNFQTETSKKLFNENTYIENFSSYYKYEKLTFPVNPNINWIFYFVKPGDYNKNGKIDSKDPSVLYVSDKHGNNLKPVTAQNENAEKIVILDKQGFALIKIQRDMNNDLNFDSKDKDYYYIRLDLKSLSLGKILEIN